jgi:hypothetical protein
MISKKEENLAGCLIISVVVGFFLLVSAWTDRSIEFWLSYAKGEAVNCPYWLSCLLTLVLNGVIFIFNVITEICRLVL